MDTINYDAIINYEYPLLNNSDKQVLIKYTKNLINEIIKWFSNNDTEELDIIEQFKLNNNRDIVAVLYMLLPYMKNKNIRSFNDIYLAREDNDIPIDKIVNPRYLFTNVQYGRCEKGDGGETVEIPFKLEYLEHNYVLLKKTIKTIANKLYVNWVNIIPIEYNDDYEDPKIKLTYQDKYNTVCNYFYHEIKYIKWLIYDYIENNTVKQYIHLLDKHISLNNILDNLSWNELSVDEQTFFKTSYENFLNKLNNYQNTNLAIVMAKYFDASYRKNKLISYKRIKKYVDAEQIDDIDDYNNIEENEILETLHSLNTNENIKFLYEYLYNIINIFKSTWYGNKFIKDNRFKEWSIIQFDSINNFVTYKNLFNYAKLISNYTNLNNEFINLPKLWSAISSDDKEIIKKKIDTHINRDSTWFNISNNISRLNRNYNINLKLIYISSNLASNLNIFIYNCLTYNGILSKFTRYTPPPYNPPQNISVAHYFLTNKPYTEAFYNTLTVGPFYWYDTYAVNWITQINFYHRYLNNRIMYVTGGTGVGKSSQVPKLLLYSLKMLDYNPTGKIACSVPRITPSINNARNISKQMGVPIEDYNKLFGGNLETRNFNIMYQNSEGKHTTPAPNGVSMTIMTDRLLLNSILQNYLLKTKSQIHNIYDIVIVDEAHEHNMNMDMILTIMKHYLYYNNAIKLIIISATMDDDEYVYRRYYREINDNRMFPINQSLIKNNLDRINVDRRIHIQPPHAIETLHKIDEYKDPGADPDKKVLEIAKTTNKGDILLFRPGVAEISKSLEFLNENLPSNIIAIPYHSKMPDHRKSFIIQLSPDSIYNFQWPKTESFDTKKSDEQVYEENEPVRKGTYTRIVIIGTNIIEASDTINTLRYVVDTGLENSALFDYKIRDETMIKRTISNSSRLQRKGRVGRVAEGTVYYMYDIEKTKKIKKPFDIVASNISDILAELLPTTSSIPKKELTDPNTTLTPNSQIYELTKRQYTYNGTLITYIGPHTPPFSSLPPIITTNVYSKEILEDADGTFYIIHPEELYIDRNINGKIIQVEEKEGIRLENGRLLSKKMQTFWKILEEYDIINNGYKTDYGQQILELHASKSMIKYPLQYVLLYHYGKLYGIEEIVLKIIVFCIITNYKINDIFENKEKIQTKTTSDIYCILGIIYNITKYFDKLLKPLFSSTYKGIIEENKYNYITNQYNKIKNKKILLKIHKLFINQTLTKSTKLTELEYKTLNEETFGDRIETLFINESYDIQRWCKVMNYKMNLIKSFLTLYYILSHELKNIYSIPGPVPIPSPDPDIVLKPFIKTYYYNMFYRIGGTDYCIYLLGPSIEYVHEFITTIDKGKVGKYILALNKDASKKKIYVLTNVSMRMIKKETKFKIDEDDIRRVLSKNFYGEEYLKWEEGDGVEYKFNDYFRDVVDVMEREKGI